MLTAVGSFALFLGASALRDMLMPIVSGGVG